MCQCKAVALGFEETNRETGGIDKICSYSCKCFVSNIGLTIRNVATTAFSKEDWDRGSHVCHGQYSWKPNLSDPNWKIVVKFDTFTLLTNGDVFYPEGATRLIANGVNLIDFDYTRSAPEISNSIKAQLKH